MDYFRRIDVRWVKILKLIRVFADLWSLRIVAINQVTVKTDHGFIASILFKSFE